MNDDLETMGLLRELHREREKTKRSQEKLELLKRIANAKLRREKADTEVAQLEAQLGFPTYQRWDDFTTSNPANDQQKEQITSSTPKFHQDLVEAPSKWNYVKLEEETPEEPRYHWETESPESIDSQYDKDSPSMDDEFDSIACMICGERGDEEAFLLCENDAEGLHGGHFRCFGLKRIPTGTWHCDRHKKDDCNWLPPKKKKRKKKNVTFVRSKFFGVNGRRGLDGKITWVAIRDVDGKRVRRGGMCSEIEAAKVSDDLVRSRKTKSGKRASLNYDTFPEVRAICDKTNV
jgi:hypothetical protein